MKPHKISTHSGHSDNCCSHFFYRLSDWVEILSWNSFSSRCWKFQLSFLKNKKVLFLKKYFLSRIKYQNKKSFVYGPNFQWRFWFDSSDALNGFKFPDDIIFGYILLDTPQQTKLIFNVRAKGQQGSAPLFIIPPKWKIKRKNCLFLKTAAYHAAISFE